MRACRSRAADCFLVACRRPNKLQALPDSCGCVVWSAAAAAVAKGRPINNEYIKNKLLPNSWFAPPPTSQPDSPRFVRARHGPQLVKQVVGSLTGQKMDRRRAISLPPLPTFAFVARAHRRRHQQPKSAACIAASGGQTDICWPLASRRPPRRDLRALSPSAGTAAGERATLSFW